MSLSQLIVTYEEIRNLVPYARNARTHSKHQIRQIAESIRAFGFTNPVLVNRSRMIVAGHGRVQAAKLLAIKKVPTICLDNLTTIRPEPTFWPITSWRKKLVGTIRFLPSNCSI